MKKSYLAPEGNYIDFNAEDLMTYSIPLDSVAPDTEGGVVEDSTVADDLD